MRLGIGLGLGYSAAASGGPSTPTPTPTGAYSPLMTQRVVTPDGAYPMSAGAGYPSTGLAYDATDGTMWGSHGTAVVSPNAGIVQLSANGQTILKQFTAASMGVVDCSAQGICIDTSDNTIFWMAKQNGTAGASPVTWLVHCTKNGVLLDQRAMPAAGYNGLAYDAIRDCLIAGLGSSYSWINKTTGATLRGPFALSGDDQIYHDPIRDELLTTGANNGDPGIVRFYSVSGTPTLKLTLTLDQCRAIEGVFRRGNDLVLASDQHTHAYGPSTFNQIQVFEDALAVTPWYSGVRADVLACYAEAQTQDKAMIAPLTTLFSGLEANSITLNSLMLCDVADERLARTDLMAPTLRTSTKTGNPSFTPNVGWTGDGVDDRLNALIANSAAYPAVDNAHFGVEFGGSPAGYLVGNSQSNVSTWLRVINSTTFGIKFGNNTTEYTGLTVPQTTGRFTFSRNDATNFSAYRQGSLLGSHAHATNSANRSVGFFHTGGSLYGSGLLKHWHSGAYLDASKVAILDGLLSDWHTARSGGEVAPPALAINSTNPSGSYPEGTPIGGTLTANLSGTAWAVTGTDASFVTLDNATGAWSLPTTDYETKTAYSFTFTATNAAQTATQNVAISISDVVEDVTAPTITSGNPTGSYAEMVPIGGTLTANETVTWAKSGTDAAFVTLNTSTGVWSLATTDYETKTSYAFTFTATDGVGLTATQNIALTITDVDESGYQPEAASYFAAMTVAPDDTRKGHINTFVTALKSAGIWTKLDRLFLFASHDAQAGLLDLLNPAQSASAVASPTFTTNKGFKGNGTDSYVDSNFNPTVGTNNYVKDSGYFGVWVNTSGTTNSTASCGWLATNGTVLILRSTSSTMSGRLNSSATLAGTSGATTTAIGMSSVNRSNATTLRLSKDGVKQVEATNNSATMVNATFCYGRSTSTTFHGTYTWAAGIIGGSLTETEVTNLYNALNTYLTAVGGNV